MNFYPPSTSLGGFMCNSILKISYLQRLEFMSLVEIREKKAILYVHTFINCDSYLPNLLSDL